MLGTKLEDTVDLNMSYDAIRREILNAYGDTPEKLWRELTHAKQDEESFRQFCLRIERRLEQFVKLAVNDSCDLTSTILKYLVLESCPIDLRTFLVEHKVAKLTVEEFSDLGVSYQDAHGR